MIEMMAKIHPVRLASIRQAAASELHFIERDGSKTQTKALLRTVLELCDYIDALTSAAGDEDRRA